MEWKKPVLNRIDDVGVSATCTGGGAENVSGSCWCGGADGSVDGATVCGAGSAGDCGAGS